jgi:hypothetical protein
MSAWIPGDEYFGARRDARRGEFTGSVDEERAGRPALDPSGTRTLIEGQRVPL